MSVFDDMLAADAMNVFSNLNEFGELVQYIPQNPTVFNDTRTIQASVDRNPLMKVGATAMLQVTGTIVSISKLLLPMRPILSGDKIKLTEDTAPRTVVKLQEESDRGMWHMVIN